MATGTQTQGIKGTDCGGKEADMGTELPSINTIERDPTEANSWWQKRAPLAMGVWGKPVLYGGIPNIESLAGSICEATGLEIVFDSGWWYLEPSMGAYVQTTEFQVESLFRRMVSKACDDGGSRSLSAVIVPLVTLSPQVVKAAKSILGVGPEFWEGKTRIVGGRREQSAPLESVSEFASQCLEGKKEEYLPLNSAYERYVLFCEGKGTPPLKKSRFGYEIGSHIQKQYGTKMRNDIRDGAKKTRGWKAVGLKR